MKKLLTLALTFLLTLTLALVTACENEPLVIKESDEFVVVKVETDKTDLTLANYMASLEEYKDMFTIENGMVVSINGIKNASDWSACWMLYTDDAEFSNADWGVVVVDGVTYYSATLGAESLVVKGGCTYIWQAQTF